MILLKTDVLVLGFDTRSISCLFVFTYCTESGVQRNSPRFSNTSSFSLHLRISSSRAGFQIDSRSESHRSLSRSRNSEQTGKGVEIQPVQEATGVEWSDIRHLLFEIKSKALSQAVGHCCEVC